MTCGRAAPSLRRPTISYSTCRPASSSTQTIEAETCRRVSGRRAIDDGRGGDQPLELRDPDTVDGGVVEDGEVIVVVARDAEVARIAKALGEIDAMRAARSEASSSTSSSSSAWVSSTCPAAAANRGRAGSGIG